MTLSRFNRSAGTNAGRADFGSLNGFVEDDFDALKIGKKLTQRFGDDLRTGAAFSTDHTASFIFVSGNGTFTADGTCLHK